MGNLRRRIKARLRLMMAAVSTPESRQAVIHTRINGYQLLVLANEVVGRSIHFGGSFEPAETKHLRDAIQADAICFDVGANVGYFTMLMAQAAAKGSVHAFEPIPLNAALLKASTELNGFTNVRINECAVGDQTGMVSFSQSSDSAYSSIHDTGRKPQSRALSVPITTLDAYIEREGIARVDLLKADVEGAEGMVVRGASKLLGDKQRRPRLILLELFEQNLEAFGNSVAAICTTVQAYGYDAFVIAEGARLVPFSAQLSKHYYNVLFVPAD